MSKFCKEEITKTLITYEWIGDKRRKLKHVIIHIFGIINHRLIEIQRSFFNDFYDNSISNIKVYIVKQQHKNERNRNQDLSLSLSFE